MPRLFLHALLFLFAVVPGALIFPLAITFQPHKTHGVITLFFLLVIMMVPFAYLWRFDYLGNHTKRRRPEP